eukprot:1154237-Pelagomonas_calceolata.AAC.13
MEVRARARGQRVLGARGRRVGLLALARMLRTTGCCIAALLLLRQQQVRGNCQSGSLSSPESRTSGA